jgi:O-antigen/teichoic acid export membrane protein
MSKVVESHISIRTPFAVILKGAAGSAILKGVALLFGVLATAFLGRVLMPTQYGYYAFASTVVTLLALPVQCGLPQLMTREIAKYQLEERWGHIRGLLLRANQLVVVLGLIMVTGLALALPVLKEHVLAVDRPTFIWAIVLLPLIALNRVRGGALIGLRKVVLGMLPDNGIRAVLFMAFIALWYWLWPFNSAVAMALQVAATAIAFLAGAVLLMRHLPRQVHASAAAFETRSWVTAIVPLTLTDALLIVNLQADLLVLGLFRDAADVGIYRAAVLVASQVTIGLTVANEVLAPHIARLHQAGDRIGLQSLVRQAQGWLALSGLVLAGICILADREILTFVFGSAYVGGATALAVLAAGQFITVVAGTNSVLLNMSGNERDVLRVFAVSAVANLAANFALVPSFGLMGAAVATTTCQLITNALLLFYVRRRLGLRPLVFGGR